MNWFGWGAPPGGASAKLEPAVTAERRPDPRVALLETAYKEVLDATKHQDDKVGRLLTATAFLTATALALANLVGGQPLPRRFSIDGQPLPSLALLCLLVFLTCVVLGVLLLIYSLAAPLKIPAFAAADPRYRKGRSSGSTRLSSQIYFLAIASTSQDDWKAKWDESQSERLESELVDMYVDESQNLAVRTDFKYARMNEATAILAFALLAFAAAAVFILAAAAAPCDLTAARGMRCTNPVELRLGYRWALAGIIFGWTFLTLMTQVRTSRLYVNQLVGVFDVRRRREWFIATAGRLFAFSLAFASAWFMVGPVSAKGFMGKVPYGLLLVGSLALLLTYVRQSKARSVVRYGAHLNFFGMSLGMIAAVGLAAASDTTNDERYAFAAAVALPLAILLVTSLGPTSGTAERRSRYRRSLAAAEAKLAGDVPSAE